MSNKIKLFKGGNFITKEIRSETLGELREELVAAGENISSTASLSLNGEEALNSTAIPVYSDDVQMANVAFVNNDKTGGTLI
tara:strand:+ start:378 stop:623 length:246 start_codon:yes stop_codon:yes gene_type:complete